MSITPEQAALSQDRAIYNAAIAGSESLRLRTDYAVEKQAERWRIRPDQARVLLLDHRMPV